MRLFFFHKSPYFRAPYLMAMSPTMVMDGPSDWTPRQILRSRYSLAQRGVASVTNLAQKPPRKIDFHEYMQIVEANKFHHLLYFSVPNRIKEPKLLKNLSHLAILDDFTIETNIV